MCAQWRREPQLLVTWTDFGLWLVLIAFALHEDRFQDAGSTPIVAHDNHCLPAVAIPYRLGLGKKAVTARRSQIPEMASGIQYGANVRSS